MTPSNLLTVQTVWTAHLTPCPQARLLNPIRLRSTISITLIFQIIFISFSNKLSYRVYTCKRREELYRPIETRWLKVWINFVFVFYFYLSYITYFQYLEYFLLHSKKRHTYRPEIPKIEKLKIPRKSAMFSLKSIFSSVYFTWMF